ncbi:MAG TPA: iron-containing alcohol dehydrogenase family protein [Acidimicrobiales bacterium]|nr:iron-containing alcohol dehydrogenase family protein [Acidimicrobiales bacterium]
MTDIGDGSRPLAPAWTHTGLAQRVHFGAGRLDVLPQVLREVGARRVLLVTTERRLASDDGQRLLRLLGRSLAATFDGTRSHVPTTTVQHALGIARDRDIDGLVSFGGGSCADLGKAVCFFVEQEAGTPGASYVDRPVLPHVSIPTTYSGAELTPFFGMTDENTRRKSGAGGPTVAPIAAIYDPVVTLDLPARVSAETGMNALAHGVECAYSPARTPEAEAIALAAIRRIAAALPLVVDDPLDVDARTEMLEGAALAGRCLLNAGVGAHHGLAQLLGGRTGMAHGLANALLLAHVVRFNADAVPEEVGRIGDALVTGAASSGLDLSDVGDVAGAIDAFRDRLRLPARLSDAGVGDDDLEAVARMAEGSPAVRANPRPVTEADALRILEAAY